MVPILVENSNFFCIRVFKLFLYIIIMTGEPTHATSEMVPRPNYHLKIEPRNVHNSSFPAMFNPLCSILSQELFEKHLCNPRIPKERNKWCHAPWLYQLSSEK